MLEFPRSPHAVRLRPSCITLEVYDYNELAVKRMTYPQFRCTNSCLTWSFRFSDNMLEPCCFWKRVVLWIDGGT